MLENLSLKLLSDIDARSYVQLHQLRRTNEDVFLAAAVMRAVV